MAKQKNIPAAAGTAQSLPVYRARAFVAADGANLGDPLGVAEDLVAGDVYQLALGAERSALRLASRERGVFHVAPATEAGHEGAEVHFDSCVTFMSPDGRVVEAVILVELNRDRRTIRDVHVFALAEMSPRIDYAIVQIDREAAQIRFAEAACVSFTRGTQITMSDGAQRPVEDLSIGDRVLTRDNGVQPIRWIGQRTTRAAGAFAPIRIREGTLNNARDLIVSPNHRLFVYQRADRLNAGQAEILVKARHLLNGDTVTRTSGGFVDYFQLLFDKHEIIYAEGIAAETFLVDETTREALPQDVADKGTATFSRSAIELDERHLQAGLGADLLKKASVGR